MECELRGGEGRGGKVVRSDWEVTIYRVMLVLFYIFQGLERW